MQLAGQLEELAQAAAADPAAVPPLRRAEPLALAAAAAGTAATVHAAPAAVDPQPAAAAQQQEQLAAHEQQLATQQQPAVVQQQQQQPVATHAASGPRACPLAQPVPWDELPKDSGNKRAAVFSAYDIVSGTGAGWGLGFVLVGAWRRLGACPPPPRPASTGGR